MKAVAIQTGGAESRPRWEREPEDNSHPALVIIPMNQM